MLTSTRLARNVGNRSALSEYRNERVRSRTRHLGYTANLSSPDRNQVLGRSMGFAASPTFQVAAAGPDLERPSPASNDECHDRRRDRLTIPQRG